VKASAVKAKSKTGGETPVRINLGEKTNFVPFFSFCPVCCFYSYFLKTSSPVLPKTRSQFPPQFGDQYQKEAHDMKVGDISNFR
jgi:hypothetical protein